MKCIDCKFWRRAEGGVIDPDSGECHRYPPKPMSEALAISLGAQRNLFERTAEDDRPAAGAGGWTDRRAMWPGTYADDFCGDYSPAQVRSAFV